jgi:hypothetical protein
MTLVRLMLRIHILTCNLIKVAKIIDFFYILKIQKFWPFVNKQLQPVLRVIVFKMFFIGRMLSFLETGHDAIK